MSKTLRQIKTQISELRYELEREMEAEYLSRSAVLQQELEDTVLAMHENGMSVNAIAREYGTKNWKTVKDLLDRAKNRGNRLENTTNEIVIEPFENDEGFPNAYKITTAQGVSTIYYNASSKVWMILDSAQEDVQTAINNESGPVWEAICQATKKDE